MLMLFKLYHYHRVEYIQRILQYCIVRHDTKQILYAYNTLKIVAVGSEADRIHNFILFYTYINAS